MRASLKGRAETGGVHLPEPALEQFHTAYKAAIDMLNKTLFFDGTSTKHGYRNIMSLSMGIADDVTLLDNSDVICGKTAQEMADYIQRMIRALISKQQILIKFGVIDRITYP